MTRRVLIPLLICIALISAPAWAWGPHPDIGMAAMKALDKSDPFRAWIGNEGMVGPLSWWNDMAGGGGVVGVGEYRIYSRDCFEIPGLKLVDYTGHGGPETGTYEVYFPRLLQAMHTEPTAASMGWLGAVLHDTEDTGAPPHAAKYSGKLHEMENWADGSKIDIAGYQPKLLGKTEEEAVKGYVKRVMELREYSLERARKLKPLAEANDRAAADPLVLECANESARAVADVLHTLGYLQSQMKPVKGAGGLAGTIKFPADPERITAKIMLQDTPLRAAAGPKFSTFADLKGHYEFRNLPPGKYTAIVMMPRCKPQTFEATLDADKQTIKDLALEVNNNLLRNGDLSVRWIRQDRPDGWRARGAQDKRAWHWTSEPFMVKPGQKLQVKVKWAKDSDAQVNIVWEDGKWVNDRAFGPDTPELVATVPDAKGPFWATISIRTNDENLKTVESVSVVVISDPSTQPSGK